MIASPEPPGEQLGQDGRLPRGEAGVRGPGPVGAVVKATVLERRGEPLAIREVELADPGRGEIRVRMAAAGVCHSDLHYLTGDLEARLPVVLGHAGMGRVEAVGPGSTTSRSGMLSC